MSTEQNQPLAPFTILLLAPLTSLFLLYPEATYLVMLLALLVLVFVFSQHRSHLLSHVSQVPGDTVRSGGALLPPFPGPFCPIALPPCSCQASLFHCPGDMPCLGLFFPTSRRGRRQPPGLAAGPVPGVSGGCPQPPEPRCSFLLEGAPPHPPAGARGAL